MYKFWNNDFLSLGKNRNHILIIHVSVLQKIVVNEFRQQGYKLKSQISNLIDL